MLVQSPERYGRNQPTSSRQNLQNRRSFQFLNSSSKWPYRKTVNNSHTQIWLRRPFICGRFCRDEIIERAVRRFSLHKTHPSTYWPHRWPQSSSPLDDASQKHSKLSKGQTPSCLHWRWPNKANNDNENDNNFCWSSCGMEDNRDCDTSAERYSSSKLTDFSLNVNNNSQKRSSQGNQFNGITNLFKKNTQSAEFSVVTPY